MSGPRCSHPYPHIRLPLVLRLFSMVLDQLPLPGLGLVHIEQKTLLPHVHHIILLTGPSSAGRQDVDGGKRGSMGRFHQSHPHPLHRRGDDADRHERLRWWWGLSAVASGVPSPVVVDVAVEGVGSTHKVSEQCRGSILLLQRRGGGRGVVGSDVRKSEEESSRKENPID